jgi:hypothetical protein
MSLDRKAFFWTVVVLSAGVVSLAVGSIASGKPTGAAAAPLVVKLKAMGGSGVAGTATLTSTGKQVRVVVKLNKPVRGSLPMHLHIGPCRIQPNFNVWESLKNGVKGRSTTVLKYTTWPMLAAKKYSIHVHLPDYTVIACGDLPRLP